jgi:hypothetical protein|tara:strand:+ start:454 stop:2535 length:2082 start_codon:yes stop_codon:yes gene_type:complete
MSIKLYKSQLTPTSKTSNVADTRKISLSEAASIGNAFKGMAKSGEKLYVKHLDIKSDNEVLEKSKEVMNGTETKTGLSETILKAKEMKDPNAAVQIYNDAWKSWLDTEKNNVSWMAKKKLSNWMSKQQLKDTNSIKVAATTNMINGLRVNVEDKVNSLAKAIIYSSTRMEKDIARKELDTLLSSNKTKELFGAKLDVLKKKTMRDIAFFGYKNVAIRDYSKALEMAKKDDRLEVVDVEKLKTHFKTARTIQNNLNKENVSKFKSNLNKNIMYNSEEMDNAKAIAIANNDNKTLREIKTIEEDAGYLVSLWTMSKADLENRINILEEYKAKKGGAMELNYARNLELSKNYLANLTKDLNNDALQTAANRDIVALNEIGFETMLETGDIDSFAEKVNERIAKAETVSLHYKTPLVYLTKAEASQITNVFKNAKNEQKIQLASTLVKAFGSKSDDVFKQISKDDKFLSHIGGLVVMNNGVVGNNVTLAVEGFSLMQNEGTKKIYSIKETDKIKYATTVAGAFTKDNVNTFSNIIQNAEYIYAALLKSEGKNNSSFNENMWEKSVDMAAGAIFIDKIGFDTKMGGFDKDTRGKLVHIPPWLKNGDFSNVVDKLKEDKSLFHKASSGQIGITEDGEEITSTSIFKERDPIFISVGNGKYIMAMGDDPRGVGAEAEFVMNDQGRFFVIDINLIQGDLIR